MGTAQQWCPRCGTQMNKKGEIRAGPRGGLRPVYICPHCGHDFTKMRR